MTTVIETRWRGVPPDPALTAAPEWTSRHGTTRERARAYLTEHYGEDWTLEEQVIAVSEWEPVT